MDLTIVNMEAWKRVEDLVVEELMHDSDHCVVDLYVSKKEVDIPKVMTDKGKGKKPVQWDRLCMDEAAWVEYCEALEADEEWKI